MPNRIIIDKESLDTHIYKLSYYYDIPGLAVAIGCGKKGIVYSGATGKKDVISGENLKPDHIFHMASVTKLFVGTALMQLSQRGLLSVEDLLTDHLPWFQMKDQRYLRITLKQMMTHTSGMGDCENYHWGHPDKSDTALRTYLTSDEVVESAFLWDPEEGKFAYSNIAYEILGAVIAEVSGMTFEEYIKVYIFDVLDMRDSTMLTFQRDMRTVATPHAKDENNNIVEVPVFPYNRAHAPSSTLTSNVLDLSKFAAAFLNRNEKILKDDGSYETIWTQYATVPNNGEGMGLSWFMRSQKGLQLYGHEGTDDGFRASFWICPEKDLYLIVAANLSGAPVKKVNKELLDYIYRDKMQTEA